LQEAHAYYYEPSRVAADGGDVSILLILLIIGLVAAIVWLVNWEPGGTKDDKTLLKEIDGIFEDLRDQAVQFNRDEAAAVLVTAQSKVTAVLDKRGLLR
jgi:hypothetical protein